MSGKKKKYHLGLCTVCLILVGLETRMISYIDNVIIGTQGRGLKRYYIIKYNCKCRITIWIVRTKINNVYKTLLPIVLLSLAGLKIRISS